MPLLRRPSGPVLIGLGLPPEAIEQILHPHPPQFTAVDILVRDYARLVI